MARFDEELEQENRDLKQIIRDELYRRDKYLVMCDGYDEVFVNDSLAYLSGSKLRSVTRAFDRVLHTNSLNRRERGQLAVVCELFEQLSTHIDQDRLSAVRERVEYFTGIKLVEDAALR